MYHSMIVSLTAKHGKTDLQVSIIYPGAMRFGARDSKALSFQMLGAYLDHGGDSDARLKALHIVADETAATVNQVILAWLRQHSPHTIPLVSAGSLEQLEENLAAAHLILTEEQLHTLDTAGVGGRLITPVFHPCSAATALLC